MFTFKYFEPPSRCPVCKKAALEKQGFEEPPRYWCWICQAITFISERYVATMPPPEMGFVMPPILLRPYVTCPLCNFPNEVKVAGYLVRSREQGQQLQIFCQAKRHVKGSNCNHIFYLDPKLHRL